MTTNKFLSALLSVQILMLILHGQNYSQGFTEHLVANNYNCWSTIAIDIDNDNDIDIVGSSRTTSRIAWWENDGNENFTEHLISTNAWYAMGIAAADMDIDGDGDIDILGSAQFNNQIKQWESDLIIGLDNETANNPDKFSIIKNHPNPFISLTIIFHSIQEESEVILKIYNSRGKEVAILVNEYQ